MSLASVAWATAMLPMFSWYTPTTRAAVAIPATMDPSGFRMDVGSFTAVTSLRSYGDVGGVLTGLTGLCPYANIVLGPTLQVADPVNRCHDLFTVNLCVPVVHGHKIRLGPGLGLPIDCYGGITPVTYPEPGNGVIRLRGWGWRGSGVGRATRDVHTWGLSVNPG